MPLRQKRAKYKQKHKKGFNKSKPKSYTINAEYFREMKSVLTFARIIIRIQIRINTQKSTREQKNIQFLHNQAYNQQGNTMATKFDFKLDNEESQFRIEENSNKKKTLASNKNHRYSVITYEKRVQLINLASSKGYSISRAARELGIKPSTGKFIVKCFRDNGKIMKKTMSQQIKANPNSQEQSCSESGPLKEEKSQKNSHPTQSEEHQNQFCFRQEPVGSFPYQMEAPIYFMGYTCEQPVMNPIMFYPNMGGVNNLTMPVFFPQFTQY